MAYLVQQSGVTGPEGRIGSGTGYHIDSKFSKTLPFDTGIVPRFDAIARRYGEDGRNIVFSNAGVHGLVYNPDATLEDKVSLLRRAAAAYNHSQHSNYHSLDYYAPIGTNLWDSSAEGAPIYVVGTGGRKIESGSGGGYGNFSAVIGDDNSVLMKSGHGDIQGFGLSPVSYFSGSPTILASVETPAPAVDTAETPAQTAVERALNYKEMSKADLNAEYDRLRSESPDTAAAEGMKMHIAYFNK